MDGKEMSTRLGLESDVQSIVEFQENLARETEDKTLYKESLKKRCYGSNIRSKSWVLCSA